ncbi:hypothetical protein Tco_0866039 [Tanacetum coccineum]
MAAAALGDGGVGVLSPVGGGPVVGPADGPVGVGDGGLVVSVSGDGAGVAVGGVVVDGPGAGAGVVVGGDTGAGVGVVVGVGVAVGGAVVGRCRWWGGWCRKRQPTSYVHRHLLSELAMLSNAANEVVGPGSGQLDSSRAGGGGRDGVGNRAWAVRGLRYLKHIMHSSSEVKNCKK